MSGSASRPFPSRDTWAIAVLYVLFFVGHGIAVPYLPVAMKRIGLDGDAIGLAMALALALQLAAPPAWGFLADATGKRGGLVATTMLGAILGLCIAGGSTTQTGFVAGFILYTLARAPVSPLLDAQALGHPAIGPALYGRVRRWGSLGFVGGVAGTGALLDRVDPRTLPLMVAAVWVLLLAAWLALRDTLREPVAASATPPSFRLLYGNRQVWSFLALAAIHFGCGVPFETYFANHASDVGLPGVWIGLAWSAGVLLEVGVLTYLGPLMELVGPRRVLIFSYAVACLRWTLTAAIPGGVALAAVQVLHGITFGAAFGASVVWMNQIVPGELRNSAQSIFTAMAFGVGGIVAQLVSGPVYARLGGSALFALAAVVQLIPLFGMLWMREPERGFASQGSRTSEPDPAAR